MMGEARRRGTYVDRRKTAIQRSKGKLLDLCGERDVMADAILRAGIAPFLDRLSGAEWEARRARIISALKVVDQGNELAKAKSIRVQDDEIVWYLYLCLQALEDPFCMDGSQVARAAPFFAGIGERWVYADRVKGLGKKIEEVLRHKRKDPDGLLFEILVALAYAEAGWEVELLDERPPAKTPDMLVKMGEIELYVECKRLARRTGYAEKERNDFLCLWDASKHVLAELGRWVWFKGVFHVEISTLPRDFLCAIFKNSLPIGNEECIIYDGPEATIQARPIDQQKVQTHLTKWRVKANSAVLSQLLGGDWAPLNSSVSILKLVRTSEVADCEAPVLGTYIDEIGWACGFTRDFDSAISIDKKAKDVTKHLSDAVQQVPIDRPSIIHIAAETLEGTDVERLRTQKVMATVEDFIMGKPVVAVRFHRFLANQTVDKLWEFDETVERFCRNGFPDNLLPLNVVVPTTTKMRSGSHWNLDSTGQGKLNEVERWQQR
jgi:hypothetical protein